MVPPHANIDLSQSLTATGKGTAPVQIPTATSGSSSIPDRNATRSTATAPPSTNYGDEGSIGAKPAMGHPPALTWREAKPAGFEHEPRKQADERTSAQQSEHQLVPVGVNALIELARASLEELADTASSSQAASMKTMFDGIGTIVGINLVGLSRTQINKQLPPHWCMQCLACHPYPGKMGSYHIRPLHKNVAMHGAIRMGNLPPVDPWYDIVEAFTVVHPPSPPPPQQRQPQEPMIRDANFEPTEEEDKMLKQFVEDNDGVKDRMERRMQCLFEFVDRKNEAIAQRNNDAAYSSQPLGSYSNAANPTEPLTGTQRMQPTGPPLRKRKHQDSAGNQQSRYAVEHAQSKRRYPANVRGSTSQNRTSTKMPPNDEAATATNGVATGEKSTQ